MLQTQSLMIKGKSGFTVISALYSTYWNEILVLLNPWCNIHDSINVTPQKKGIWNNRVFETKYKLLNKFRSGFVSVRMQSNPFHGLPKD